MATVADTPVPICETIKVENAKAGGQATYILLKEATTDDIPDDASRVKLQDEFEEEIILLKEKIEKPVEFLQTAVEDVKESDLGQNKETVNSLKDGGHTEDLQIQSDKTEEKTAEVSVIKEETLAVQNVATISNDEREYNSKSEADEPQVKYEECFEKESTESLASRALVKDDIIHELKVENEENALLEVEAQNDIKPSKHASEIKEGSTELKDQATAVSPRCQEEEKIQPSQLYELSVREESNFDPDHVKEGMQGSKQTFVGEQILGSSNVSCQANESSIAETTTERLVEVPNKSESSEEIVKSCSNPTDTERTGENSFIEVEDSETKHGECLGKENDNQSLAEETKNDIEDDASKAKLKVKFEEGVTSLKEKREKPVEFEDIRASVLAQNEETADSVNDGSHPSDPRDIQSNKTDQITDSAAVSEEKSPEAHVSITQNDSSTVSKEESKNNLTPEGDESQVKHEECFEKETTESKAPEKNETVEQNEEDTLLTVEAETQKHVESLQDATEEICTADSSQDRETEVFVDQNRTAEFHLDDQIEDKTTCMKEKTLEEKEQSAEIEDQATNVPPSNILEEDKIQVSDTTESNFVSEHVKEEGEIAINDTETPFLDKDELDDQPRKNIASEENCVKGSHGNAETTSDKQVGIENKSDPSGQSVGTCSIQTATEIVRENSSIQVDDSITKDDECLENKTDNLSWTGAASVGIGGDESEVKLKAGIEEEATLLKEKIEKPEEFLHTAVEEIKTSVLCQSKEITNSLDDGSCTKDSPDIQSNKTDEITAISEEETPEIKDISPVSKEENNDDTPKLDESQMKHDESFEKEITESKASIKDEKNTSHGIEAQPQKQEGALKDASGEISTAVSSQDRETMSLEQNLITDSQQHLDDQTDGITIDVEKEKALQEKEDSTKIEDQVTNLSTRELPKEENIQANQLCDTTDISFDLEHVKEHVASSEQTFEGEEILGSREVSCVDIEVSPNSSNVAEEPSETLINDTEISFLNKDKVDDLPHENISEENCMKGSQESVKTSTERQGEVENEFEPSGVESCSKPTATEKIGENSSTQIEDSEKNDDECLEKKNDNLSLTETGKDNIQDEESEVKLKVKIEDEIIFLKDKIERQVEFLHTTVEDIKASALGQSKESQTAKIDAKTAVAAASEEETHVVQNISTVSKDSEDNIKPKFDESQMKHEECFEKESTEGKASVKDEENALLTVEEAQTQKHEEFLQDSTGEISTTASSQERETKILLEQNLTADCQQYLEDQTDDIRMDVVKDKAVEEKDECTEIKYEATNVSTSELPKEEKIQADQLCELSDTTESNLDSEHAQESIESSEQTLECEQILGTREVSREANEVLPNSCIVAEEPGETAINDTDISFLKIDGPPQENITSEEKGSQEIAETTTEKQVGVPSKSEPAGESVGSCSNPTATEETGKNPSVKIENPEMKYDDCFEKEKHLSLREATSDATEDDASEVDLKVTLENEITSLEEKLEKKVEFLPAIVKDDKASALGQNENVSTAVSEEGSEDKSKNDVDEPQMKYEECFEKESIESSACKAPVKDESIHELKVENQVDLLTKADSQTHADFQQHMDGLIDDKIADIVKEEKALKAKEECTEKEDQTQNVLANEHSKEKIIQTDQLHELSESTKSSSDLEHVRKVLEINEEIFEGDKFSEPPNGQAVKCDPEISLEHDGCLGKENDARETTREDFKDDASGVALDGRFEEELTSLKEQTEKPDEILHTSMEDITESTPDHKETTSSLNPETRTAVPQEIMSHRCGEGPADVIALKEETPVVQDVSPVVSNETSEDNSISKVDDSQEKSEEGFEKESKESSDDKTLMKDDNDDKETVIHEHKYENEDFLKSEFSETDKSFEISLDQKLIVGHQEILEGQSEDGAMDVEQKETLEDKVKIVSGEETGSCGDTFKNETLVETSTSEAIEGEEVKEERPVESLQAASQDIKAIAIGTSSTDSFEDQKLDANQHGTLDVKAMECLQAQGVTTIVLNKEIVDKSSIQVDESLVEHLKKDNEKPSLAEASTGFTSDLSNVMDEAENNDSLCREKTAEGTSLLEKEVQIQKPAENLIIAQEVNEPSDSNQDRDSNCSFEEKTAREVDGEEESVEDVTPSISNEKTEENAFTGKAVSRLNHDEHLLKESEEPPQGKAPPADANDAEPIVYQDHKDKSRSELPYGTVPEVDGEKPVQIDHEDVTSSVSRQDIYRICPAEDQILTADDPERTLDIKLKEKLTENVMAIISHEGSKGNVLTQVDDSQTKQVEQFNQESEQQNALETFTRDVDRNSVEFLNGICKDDDSFNQDTEKVRAKLEEETPTESLDKDSDKEIEETKEEHMESLHVSYQDDSSSIQHREIGILPEEEASAKLLDKDLIEDTEEANEEIHVESLHVACKDDNSLNQDKDLDGEVPEKPVETLHVVFQVDNSLIQDKEIATAELEGEISTESLNVTREDDKALSQKSEATSKEAREEKPVEPLIGTGNKAVSQEMGIVEDTKDEEKLLSTLHTAPEQEAALCTDKEVVKEEIANEESTLDVTSEDGEALSKGKDKESCQDTIVANEEGESEQQVESLRVAPDPKNDNEDISSKGDDANIVASQPEHLSKEINEVCQTKVLEDPETIEDRETDLHMTGKEQHTEPNSVDTEVTAHGSIQTSNKTTELEGEKSTDNGESVHGGAIIEDINGQEQDINKSRIQEVAEIHHKSEKHTDNSSQTTQELSEQIEGFADSPAEKVKDAVSCEEKINMQPDTEVTGNIEDVQRCVEAKEMVKEEGDHKDLQIRTAVDILQQEEEGTETKDSDATGVVVITAEDSNRDKNELHTEVSEVAEISHKFQDVTGRISEAEENNAHKSIEETSGKQSTGCETMEGLDDDSTENPTKESQVKADPKDGAEAIVSCRDTELETQENPVGGATEKDIQEELSVSASQNVTGASDFTNEMPKLDGASQDVVNEITIETKELTSTETADDFLAGSINQSALDGEGLTVRELEEPENQETEEDKKEVVKQKVSEAGDIAENKENPVPKSLNEVLESMTQVQICNVTSEAKEAEMKDVSFNTEPTEIVLGEIEKETQAAYEPTEATQANVSGEKVGKEDQYTENASTEEEIIQGSCQKNEVNQGENAQIKQEEMYEVISSPTEKTEVEGSKIVLLESKENTAGADYVNAGMIKEAGLLSQDVHCSTVVEEANEDKLPEAAPLKLTQKTTEDFEGTEGDTNSTTVTQDDDSEIKHRSLILSEPSVGKASEQGDIQDKTCTSDNMEFRDEKPVMLSAESYKEKESEAHMQGRSTEYYNGKDCIEAAKIDFPTDEQVDLPVDLAGNTSPNSSVCNKNIPEPESKIFKECSSLAEAERLKPSKQALEEEVEICGNEARKVEETADVSEKTESTEVPHSSLSHLLHEVAAKKIIPTADKCTAEKEPAISKENLHTEKAQLVEQEEAKTDEEKDSGEESGEHHMSDCGSEAPVMVEVGDADVKVTPKKSHNLLSGVGSKMKHSIAKVKKAITGKSPHPKPPSPKKAPQ